MRSDPDCTSPTAAAQQPMIMSPSNPRFQTPANAIISQGVLAISLIVSGTFLIMVPPTGREAVIRRIVEMAMFDRHSDLPRRITWGLQGEGESVA